MSTQEQKWQTFTGAEFKAWNEKQTLKSLKEEQKSKPSKLLKKRTQGRAIAALNWARNEIKTTLKEIDAIDCKVDEGEYEEGDLRFVRHSLDELWERHEAAETERDLAIDAICEMFRSDNYNNKYNWGDC